MKPVTEAEIQESIVDYLKVLEGQGKLLFTAVTNNVPFSGIKAIKSQQKFARLGLQKGFPDLLVIVPQPEGNRPFNMYWEIKRPGQKLEHDQQIWAENLLAFKCDHRVIHSLEEAQEALAGWV